MNTYSFDKIVKGRRVILWGVGITGKDFYSRFRNKIEIDGCTCSDEEFDCLDGINGYDHEKLTREKDYIIICSIHFEEIRKYLYLIGYKPLADYIRWDHFISLFNEENENKRIVVAIGQCEIFEMSYGLSKIKAIQDDYAIICFDERKVCFHGDKFCIEEAMECQSLIRITDFFLRPTVFAEKGRIGFDYYTKQVKDDATIVIVSIFEFDGYWPQDIDKGRNTSKFYMICSDKKLKAYAPRDGFVEKLVDKGWKTNEILKTVLRDDVFDFELVHSNLIRSLKIAKITDRSADIKISDYIENYYSSIKLYGDRGHFNSFFLLEYIKRLVKYFNPDIDEEKAVEEIDLSYLFQNVNEFPIYPCTAKYLNLSFINDDTLYRMIRYSGIKMVSFEEYMDNLIQYYINGKKILRSC